MSEIFGAINLKNKITIASSMAIFAVLLATVIGVLTFATVDTHTHVYDYRLEIGEDGGFDLVGVCRVDNCEKPFYREKNISGVKLLSAVSPTCENEGNRVYTYTFGDITLKHTEELPVNVHSYDYERGTHNGYDYIIGSCTVCEKTVFEDKIEDIRLESFVEGSCFTPRKETYVYTVNGEEHIFSTLVNVDIPHTINGKPATEYEIISGVYPIGTPGMKLLGNEKIPCGQTGDGYYVCEDCKVVEVVKLSRPEHLFLYKEENLVAPTLEEDGVVTLVCHNPECTEVKTIILPKVDAECEFVEDIPATELSPRILRYSYENAEYGFKFENDYKIGKELSHNYVYHTLTLNPETSKFEVLGTCDQPGCQAREGKIEDVKAVFVEDTSTCLTEGFIKWSYVQDGKTLYWTAASKLTDHNYTYDLDDVVYPSFDEDGSIELYCSTKGCDHTVSVILPKMVVGEGGNTTLTEEDDFGKTYLYFCETEYNCPVILDVFVKHNYKYDPSKAEIPKQDAAGSVELWCSDEGCERTVTIELPAVVIDENAFFDYENHIGKVYKYIYETEYNCTVELNITIY